MQTRQFTAIPTRFEGVVYRSRLEARWAAFFKLLGWNFEYEPFECEGWIPDFVLIGAKGNTLVEVKPRIDQVNLAKVTVPGYETLCVSAIPFEDHGEGIADVLAGGGETAFGLLVGDGKQFDDGSLEFGWGNPDLAVFNKGGPSFHRTSNVDFRGATGSFAERLSGEYDGDHHLHWRAEHDTLVRTLWKMAGNQTQWRPAR